MGKFSRNREYTFKDFDDFLVNVLAEFDEGAEIERFESAFKEITVESGGVDLRGFMKSEVVDVPAKKGRNPKTGETIDIAPKKVVKIKVSSKFKNLTEE